MTKIFESGIILSMKRTIIIEILGVFILAVLITLGVSCIQVSINNFTAIDEMSMEAYKILHEIYLTNARRYLAYSILALVAALCDLAAMVLVAIHNFPCFKPLLDKHAAKCDERKQAKAERAEADKQARIERLTAELEELKKDE